jgi:ATP-dependent helicase/nuclease subunit A
MPDCLAWVGRIADDVAALTDARARTRRDTENEHRRLLYVAMTRAAERLVVCGLEGERQRPQGCWYDLVNDALAPLAEEVATPKGPILRYRKVVDGAADGRATADASVAPSEIVLPPWLSSPPARVDVAEPLSPARAYDESIADRVPPDADTAARREALARGRLLHRLLQSLPDIPAERRAAAARTFLAREGDGFASDAQTQLLDRIFAVLEAPRFAPLFAPGSRAEVPVVGRIDRPGRTALVVSGQIDRLVVTKEAVLIADYKTNRVPPRRLDDVPEAYVAQLALYRAVLARLYPDHPVGAALIWTHVPDLMEIPAARLDRALARLTTA